ncbi:MAG TPA: PepSY-associated TM helix domain-containing protein, partial [Azoarcus sp.]|nr:PepSY-associated TM helix domain-containing protein [Azoarcus sp.]
MRTDFRDAMHRLHTGVGVTLGGLLLVIFWMGTLSVFDREIDRWMMPETRLSAPHATLSSFDD